MDEILAIATDKGGFGSLSAKEKTALARYTKTVKEYEDIHCSIPMPQTLQGLIELKMYERKMKQKDIAKLLHTTDTKPSAVMQHKRKPNVSPSRPCRETRHRWQPAPESSIRPSLAHTHWLKWPLISGC
jgi:HTH-type transcriptional regulator/antitoxin HigA